MKFLNMKQLLAHHNEKHAQFKCDVCQKAFLNRKCLELHIRCFHEEIKCDVCCKIFKRRKYLLRHLKIHQRNTIPCTKCPLKFTDITLLEKHLMMHNKKYECALCGRYICDPSNF